MLATRRTFRAKSFSPLSAHARVPIFRHRPPNADELPKNPPTPSLLGRAEGGAGCVGVGGGVGPQNRTWIWNGPRCSEEPRRRAKKNLQTEGDRGRAGWRTTAVAAPFQQTEVDRAPSWRGRAARSPRAGDRREWHSRPAPRAQWRLPGAQPPRVRARRRQDTPAAGSPGARPRPPRCARALGPAGRPLAPPRGAPAPAPPASQPAADGTRLKNNYFDSSDVNM